MSMETLEKSRRKAQSNDPHDPYTEVWDGVTVVSPSAHNEHSTISGMLAGIVFTVTNYQSGDRIGVVPNVSDRQHGWEKNYRIPDITVVLANGSAIDHGTHWEGGPDFLVEIISPGEDPHIKLPFYEKINTSEVLIVHRDPWLLELFQLNGSKLDCVGISDMALSQTIASGVLPLTFQLVRGPNRPEIVVCTQTQQQWRV